ncbi:MAG: hypothetical protein JXA16_11155 [Bacteroidales bacterium]|nr:hypothetical protein [Bacteroidales bacterium]
MNKQITRFLILTLLFISFGCASISKFDQYAYIQTTSLKVDALNVMSLATEEYYKHEKAVYEFETNLQKIYEYEKNRPKNEITLKLWDKLLNKEGHLLGGFIEKWKTDTILNIVYINEKKDQVSEAFDQIAGLESKKIKPSDL